jgi:hypothetical protein
VWAASDGRTADELLERTSEWEADELLDTYPFGV